MSQHTLAWVDPQLSHPLRRETINGVPCFILGHKVVPVRAIAPAIPRDQVDELVSVREGVYHRGCHAGGRLINILVAMDCGAVPCSAQTNRQQVELLPVSERQML
jgi:hypothetical protein